MHRILFFLLFFSIAAFGQTARDDFDNAAKAYENNNHLSALKYLQSTITKLKTTNPKIESLKALCFYAQEDYINSKIALNKYFKMVAATQSASENHQSLMIVSSRVDEELQKEEKNFEQTMLKKRLEKATLIEEEAKQNLGIQLLRKIETAGIRMLAIYNDATDKWGYSEAMNNTSSKKNGKINIGDGNYTGDYVGDKIRHGNGTMLYNNEPKYKAVWEYKGQWKNDRRHGEGTLKSIPYKKGDIVGADGGIEEEIYTGIWINDVLQGIGKYKKGSWIYEGNFVNGKMEGQGTSIDLYGNKYVGEWKNGLKDGNGTDGLYSGDWKNDYREGKGIYKASTYTEEGQWKKGRLDGFAVYKNNNGESYEGYWVKGNKEGQGTFVYENGEKYVGDWKKNNKEGNGTYTWPNGNRYEGNWGKGSRFGQGTMTYQNGEKYEGEWKDNKMQGIGILYDKNNMVLQQGKWFYDKYVDAASLIKPVRLYAKDILAKYNVINKDTSYLICYSLAKDSINFYFYTPESSLQPTIYFDVNNNNEVDTLVDRFYRNFRDKLQNFYIKGGAATTNRIWQYQNDLVIITYPIKEISQSNIVAFQVAYKNYEEGTRKEVYVPSRKEEVDFKRKKLFYITITP